jgi:hypothetical protein
VYDTDNGGSIDRSELLTMFSSMLLSKVGGGDGEGEPPSLDSATPALKEVRRNPTTPTRRHTATGQLLPSSVSLPTSSDGRARYAWAHEHGRLTCARAARPRS